MRIVIVEDEVQTREGLSRLIERIDPRYRVVGSAANGQKGLELIYDKRPDVVITDIRMPQMDGLEMIESLARLNVTPKYIVISAFSEFSYARRAMSFGASEYLLKPISMMELKQAMEKLELQLQSERMHTNEQTLEQTVAAMVLGTDGTNSEALTKIAEKYRLSPTEPMALVLFYLGVQYEERKNSIVHLSYPKFQVECAQISTVYLSSKRSVLLVLSGLSCPDEFSKWLQSIVQIHSQMMWKDIDISYAMCHGLPEIHSTAMDLLKIAPWKISLPGQKLLCYPDVLQTPHTHCAYPSNIENGMRVAICAQNAEKVQQYFEQFEIYFSGRQVYLPQEIKDSYTRFLWSVTNVSKEVGHVSSTETRYKQMVEHILQAQNLGELNKVLHFVAEDLSARMKHEAAAQENLTVKRAKSLIHEFYSDGITLEEIAHKLGITPEYLSTQFRKETGNTFSNYIRDYRIKKSKELLLGTQLKLHQISAQIGYSDPKYFSQVFKKVVGQLPADYRKTQK